MRNPHLKIIFLAAGISIGMFGFTFALSPLYNKLCNSFDFYAGVRTLSTIPPTLNRSIKIEFATHNNENLPWDFYPRTVTLNIHPNENIKVIFVAKNNSARKMTVQAIPSFSPSVVAKHFHKTECFCFTQQTLQPGASINMPLIFHVDADLPRAIPTFTLAYTLFDVTHKVSSRNSP